MLYGKACHPTTFFIQIVLILILSNHHRKNRHLDINGLKLANLLISSCSFYFRYPFCPMATFKILTRSPDRVASGPLNLTKLGIIIFDPLFLIPPLRKCHLLISYKQKKHDKNMIDKI